MQVSFGNLPYPKPTNNPDKPEAKAKMLEMMSKLDAAGFKRIEKTADVDSAPKQYHIYDLPHKIEFSSDVNEAVKIMTPYSDYMQPLMVVG